MPLSPPRHRRPSLPAGNHALANGDQNLTEVDTRLTKVDKGCQKLTAPTPAPTPNPSKTRQNHNRLAIPSTQRQPSLSTLPAHPEQT